MSLGIEHYLILSAVLFSIGLYGALAKRNAVAILMCIEIMLNAVNIAMVAFSRYLVPDVVVLTGHVFAIFIMTVAAAEAAVGLAIIIAIYRSRQSVDVEQMTTIFSFKTPIEVEIHGYNLRQLQSISEEIQIKMNKIPGLFDVKASIQRGNPEVQIIYNRQLLSHYGLLDITLS